MLPIAQSALVLARVMEMAQDAFAMAAMPWVLMLVMLPLKGCAPESTTLAAFILAVPAGLMTSYFDDH